MKQSYHVFSAYRAYIMGFAIEILFKVKSTGRPYLIVKWRVMKTPSDSAPYHKLDVATNFILKSIN